jgi:hypothetical protein
MPGCADVVVDGGSGFVVPPGRPEVLAARILDLLNDPAAAHKMGQCARLRVQEHFSLDKIVDRYTAAYQQLLSSQACPVGERSSVSAHQDFSAPELDNTVDPAPPGTTAISRCEHVRGNTKADG